MQWDFWTLSPESAHQVTYLMGDRGIPNTWRHMNGYSSHTYSWLNGDGELFWVKYHFKTDQGIDFLTQQDADRLAGEDGDYHQRDLSTSIEDGDLPSWTLQVQIMPFEEAKTYRFNPFDLTRPRVKGRARTRAVAGVRVLEERRPRSRQEDRGRRPRQQQRRQLLVAPIGLLPYSAGLA
jgi:catalase